MLFSDVLGQEHLKKHLTGSFHNGRIPHAQLFVGHGVLPLVIAYSQYILCGNREGENMGGNDSCNLKFGKLSHPDLHFAYPVATTDKVKSKPVSSNFAEEWRQFVLQQPYGDLSDWHAFLGIDKKQSQIGVDEAMEVVKKLSLKSYEGGFKIMIVWMAEKMNTACANKLLKLIEEPPEKTLFILVAENDEQLLTTIKSRCQVLRFPLLPEEVIAKGLVQKEGATYEKARNCARQAAGNYALASHILKDSGDNEQFESWIIFWVRSAFRAKGNKGVINELMQWSDQVADTGREIQKRFLDYCVSFFRQAMLLNYNAPSLVYLKVKDEKFALEKFAPFVHGGNITEIIDALSEANYHIERNGNAKIIFTDLSIKLTRLLHQKG